MIGSRTRWAGIVAATSSLWALASATTGPVRFVDRANGEQAPPWARSDTTIVCTPSLPLARGTDTILVLVAVDSATPSDQVAWEVSQGRLLGSDGSGARQRWFLGGGWPGWATVTARVTRGGQLVGSCTARVLVPPDQSRGAEDLAVRTLWTPERQERDAYGLYSYVLLGAPPADSVARERYRAAIGEALRATRPLQALEARLAVEDTLQRRNFNVTYIPVRTRPRRVAGVDTVAEVLSAYDYDRATLLLSRLAGAHPEGPYLVSLRTPLSRADSSSRPLLVQDLSAVPVRLVPLWIAQFLNDVGQQRLDDGWSARRAALRLRTAVGVLAEGLPSVRTAIADWSAMFGRAVTSGDEPSR